MRDKLLATLASAAELLTTCGEQDRASWFQEKLAILTKESTESAAFQEAIGELRHVLAGMGSFSDLSLSPAQGLRITRQEARQRQWDLVEDLGEAIQALIVERR